MRLIATKYGKARCCNSLASLQRNQSQEVGIAGRHKIGHSFNLPHF
jgi:hypothetical protein